MTSTGRAVQIASLGSAPLEGIEHRLRIVEQPAPAPAAGDVVVRVKSAAVGWVDVLMTSGQYQHVPAPPYTPGLEYAGEVAAIGEGVTAWKVGDRVLADGLMTGPRSLGAHRRWGGFATYAVAPEGALFALPGPLDFDQAACLLGGAETAYHALVARARVAPGDSVLVLGASGSTGLATVRLAKLLGATVIAVGRAEAKLAIARAHGADHLVVLGEGRASLRDQVKALTGGEGASVVYDPVGGELSTQALRAAAFGARYLVVGWAATPLVGRNERDPNALPTNLILMKGIDVLGSPAAIAAHRDPAIRTERLARILAWASAGELTPHVSAQHRLDDVIVALREKWAGGAAGNVVLRP